MIKRKFGIDYQKNCNVKSKDISINQEIVYAYILKQSRKKD